MLSDNPYFKFTATTECGASVRAEREGGLAVITPLRPGAESWLHEHVRDEATWSGDRLVVEMRFFPILADALMAAGFTFERHALPS